MQQSIEKTVYDLLKDTSKESSARVAEISHLLKSSEVESLNFKYYEDLGDEGTILLAQALENNISLKLLKLKQCSVGDEGAKALANFLAQNKTLKNLNLSNNKIGSEGIQWLSKFLAKNKSLTSLDLRGNDIGDKAADQRALYMAINFSTSLTSYSGPGECMIERIMERNRLESSAASIKPVSNKAESSGNSNNDFFWRRPSLCPEVLDYKKLQLENNSNASNAMPDQEVVVVSQAEYFGNSSNILLRSPIRGSEESVLKKHKPENNLKVPYEELPDFSSDWCFYG